MNKIIIIIALVFVVILYLFFNWDNKQPINQPTSSNKSFFTSDDIHQASDDKLTTEESNNRIALSVRELSEQVAQLSQEVSHIKQQINARAVVKQPVKNNTNQPNPVQLPIAVTITKKPVVKPVVEQLANKINQTITGLSNAPIGSPNTQQNPTTNQNTDDGFTWSSGVNSLPVTHTLNIQKQQSLSDKSIAAALQQNDAKQEQHPRYTIAENTFLRARLKTNLLGRIPILGKVTDPYRFVIDIYDQALFANFKSHKELTGMRMSGLAQGDLLLNCAKGSIDSITYIFGDETIAQVNGVDLAIITDKYGQPCLQGQLITNVAKTISISAGLSVLSSTAAALAQGEKKITQSADGSTQSAITGDVAKFALNKGIGDGLSSINQWVSDRAKSSFDVIKVPSGTEIVLLTQKEIAINYKPNGRKLRHQASSNHHEKLSTQLD